jgi:uncharacterized protein (TIGR03032 family)
MAKRLPSDKALESLWARHHATWRDPAQVASQWQEAAATDPQLLHYRVEGAWWETLAAAGITLLVSREYEHLVLAMQAGQDRPRLSYLPLPHPSGLVADRERAVVHIATTRNPNQIFEFRPVNRLLPRLDVRAEEPAGRPLLPARSHFLPGCLYLHDLALIDGVLHANAVGHNAVIRLDPYGGYEPVWWPACIDSEAGPIFGQNHLQLNGIAAGPNLAGSYFSASTDRVSARRPGHKNFAVDGRGVIFSGASREAVAYGLTRPHSVRLHDGRIWVDNSGYGELGWIEAERFLPLVRLPGWTRGLCFHDGVAFVGTSRVIPRFRHYAPGLAVETSQCGVHAVEVAAGRVLGSLIWPYGNQIFALDWLPAGQSSGFPFRVGAKRATTQEKILFYAFENGSGFAE